MSKCIQVLLLGDTCATKMDMAYRFCGNIPSDEELAEDGIFCVQFDVSHNQELVTLKVTSIPEDPKYNRILPPLFADCDVAVLCFSLKFPVSLQNLFSWDSQIQENIKTKILVGNHQQEILNEVVLNNLMKKGIEPVSAAEINDAEQRLGTKGTVFVESKLNLNLDKVFQLVTELGYKK
ncbi:Conserved_hypothetical protein [Hexamita inflata]|uniref:Uncharacterized protein n=1 Tax=Hexamita inflata TaxID=28002 RepID=A0ABP1HRM9_9EUKA